MRAQVCDGCDIQKSSKSYYLVVGMFYIIKIFVYLLKRLLKLTFCLLWIVLFLFVVIIYLNRTDHSSTVVNVHLRNPVILWWPPDFPGTSGTKRCANEIKCEIYSDRNVIDHFDVDAFLFYGSTTDFNDLPLPRKPKDVIWGLFHEESPRNTEELMHEQILSLFNFSATYSRHSDVSFPLQYLESFDDITSRKYFVETSVKNALLKDIAPVMFLQTDCDTSTEREAYVKELMKFTKIDSYGQCLRNKELPKKFTEDYLNNLNEDEFLKFVGRYKFVVAIENGVCDDYVTEKYWRAIKVGTVPIYFGSPLIKDWFPNIKSAILIEDHPTPEILSLYLDRLMKNNSLYEEYLEHKTKQVITNNKLKEEIKLRPYQLDTIETVDNFECLICEKLHKKREGKLEMSMVTKSHYNCPKPRSALTLGESPTNSWIYSWIYKQTEVQKIYDAIAKN